MLNKYLSLVKFSHTIFALPFALIGGLLGITVASSLTTQLLLLILVCMVTARSAAMGYNRYADADIDAINPRTASRDLPAGRITRSQALYFIIICSALFMVAAYIISPLCAILAPVALITILGYSHTKRFTPMCHYVLGVGLGLAPIGAYVAVADAFHPGILLIGGAVALWVGGFDVIYALQDADFDGTHGLKSIPSVLGPRRSIWIARMNHLVCLPLLAMGGAMFFEARSWLGLWSVIGFAAFALCLIYQHRVVRLDRIDRIDQQFFAFNGTASMLIGMCVLLDYFL